MAARSSRLAALVVALGMALVAVACESDGDESVLASLADPSTTATLPAGATGDAIEILIVEGGFDRESADAAVGATLRIINESDSPRSVIVSGGNHSDEPVEIKPGEMLELPDLEPGAYIITAADDPSVTAAIVVS